MDHQPYSIVEDIGFKNLIHKLDSKFNIPSKWQYSNKIIPEIYD